MAVSVRWFLAFLLFPAVSAFNELLVHKKSHESGSVRILKPNETVRETGSDLIFNWERCVVCDGYDVRLFLRDSSQTEEAHYQLKSAVTALRVPKVRPRTNYRLVIRTLPTDSSSSELSGRTFASETPPPVGNLTARMITSTSIQIEWTSENADGFVARIFDDDSVVQERVIPDFSNHSTVKVTDLEPETTYRVEVTAFYFPPTGKSTSAVSSVQIKTLPAVLPKIQLNWKLNPRLELFWENPDSPPPVAHSVVCTRDSRSTFVAEFSGVIDFVVLSDEVDSKEIQCTLETSYSDDSSSKVTSTAQIKRVSNSSPERPSVSTSFECRGAWSTQRADVSASMKYSTEELDGIESLVLDWERSSSGPIEFHQILYRIRTEDGTYPNGWLPGEDKSRILVNRVAMKPWVPQLVEFRLRYQCEYDSNSLRETPVGSLKIPPLLGPVDPVSEVTVTSEQVTWKYDRSSGQPDHFLVTYCVGDHCTSQSVSGRDRSLKLEGLKERRVYFVTIQAVQRRNDRIFVSPTKMTSFVAPKKTSETVTLRASEVADSSTVRLLIIHNVTSDTPRVVKYHIAVCGRHIPIWTDPALETLSSTNASCESMVSTEPSLDLERQPWTVYEVSVVLCYGTYDFNDPVNLTIPVFKQNPAPVTGLTWDAESARLSWIYESSITSGFSISICPSIIDGTINCSRALTSPLERQYQVDATYISDARYVASVTPFVTYQGSDYYGFKSEIEIDGKSATAELQSVTMASSSQDEYSHSDEHSETDSDSSEED